MKRRSILDDGKGNWVIDDSRELTPEIMERARINAELDAADAAAEAAKAAAMPPTYKHVLDGPKDWSWVDAADAKRKAAKKKAKATPKLKKPKRSDNTMQPPGQHVLDGPRDVSWVYAAEARAKATKKKANKTVARKKRS